MNGGLSAQVGRISDGSWVGKKHPNLDGVRPSARDNVWPPTEQQQRHGVAGSCCPWPTGVLDVLRHRPFCVAEIRRHAVAAGQCAPRRVRLRSCPAPAVHQGQAPVPASVGLETLAKKISIVRGPPVGREEDSQTNDEDGALLLPASQMVVSGRRRRRLRPLVDHMMGDGSSNQDSLLERKALRTLATRRNHYNTLLTFLAFSKQSIRAWCSTRTTASHKGVQHNHGSRVLAAVMAAGQRSAASGLESPPLFEKGGAS